MILDTEPQTIVLEDGHASIGRYGTVTLRPFDGCKTIILGAHDLAELFRTACGSDHEALRVLAHNMATGHRYTGDPAGDEREVPF